MFLFFSGEIVSKCSHFVLIQNLNVLLRLPLIPYIEWINIFSFPQLLETDFQITSRSQKFFKICILKNFYKVHRKTPVLESLFDKVVGLKACNFTKKRFKTRFIFPCEYCKIIKNTLFTEHFRPTASMIKQMSLCKPAENRFSDDCYQGCWTYRQKQSFRGFLRKKCSKNMQ